MAFTSILSQAWIVDEAREERAGEAFLRGSQAGQAGGLIAIPIGIALGSVTVRLPILLGQALAWNAEGIVLVVAGFGLTRNFWAAVALYWAVGVLRGIHGSLASTCFNGRIDDPQVRVMMFSVRGQVDAVGQITSGPIMGVIGNASIRAALVALAAILSPVLPLYRIAIRRGERESADGE